MLTTTFPTTEDPSIKATDIKYITKRDGSLQLLDQSKIRMRLENLAKGLNMEYINFDVIVNKVYAGIYSGKLSF